MAEPELSASARLVVDARRKSLLNQEKFAELYGKTQSQISKYEKGKLNPPSDMVIQLMNFMLGEHPTESLSPKALALDVEALRNTESTLPIRRAIRDMLQLSRQAD